jgi:hypothetical protein
MHRNVRQAARRRCRADKARDFAKRVLSLLALCLLAAIAHAASVASESPSPWQQTAPLLTPRSGAGIVEAHGIIYAVGGIDGMHFLKSSEFSAIQSDGTLRAWRSGSALNEERGFFGAAEHKGFVYAVGGGNGPGGFHLLRSVERAAILVDGSLGPWRKETHLLNFPRRCAKVVVAGDYLYAIGGFGGVLFDSVERAHINADGSLGAWEFLDGKLTMPRYIHAVAEANGRIYVMGGHAQQGGAGEAETEFTALEPQGQLSAWRAATALNHGRYGLIAAAHGDFLYAMGGMSGASFFDVVEKNQVGADGAPGAWHDDIALPAPLADFGAIVYRDWLYLIGGTDAQGYFNNVFFASLDAQGNIRPPSVQADHPALPPTPVTRVELPNEGAVLQALDGGTYIYLEVDTGAGREWLAAANLDVKAGDRIRYSDGIWMRDFFSRFLQRRFDAIRFVGNLEKITPP